MKHYNVLIWVVVAVVALFFAQQVNSLVSGITGGLG